MKRKKKLKKIKKIFVILSLISISIVLGYSLIFYFFSGAYERGILICPDDKEYCIWQAHVHAKLTIKICGKEIGLPIEKGSLSAVHTHEEKNLLHWHSQVLIDKNTMEMINPESLMLKTLFKELGWNFNSNQILEWKNGDTCNGKEGKVKMFVNGEENFEFENYIIKEGDEIVILFE